MSLIVVIKGPDATAGSIFSLLIISGTVAPTIVEILNVKNRDTPTMPANQKLP